MKCDSWASFLACTFANPCFGCEPKARVAMPFSKFSFFFKLSRIIMHVFVINIEQRDKIDNEFINMMNEP
jgi:hypothetical protein